MGWDLAGEEECATRAPGDEQREIERKKKKKEKKKKSRKRKRAKITTAEQPDYKTQNTSRVLM